MNSTLFVTSESTKDLRAFATTDIADGLGNITTYSASYNHVFAGLTSVLLTIYMLIILGFLVGHFRLLSKAQARGFGRFVYRYAISAILFTTTMTIRLEAIQWQAIWSIFIARLLMFFVSTIACLVISRGQLLGLSAIASLLLTDSNDIAVMYPTFQILHPSMAKHCCIVVALQILLLKPITFLLLEMNVFRERRMIQRHATLTSASSSSPRMTLRTLFKILCQILLDPQLIAFSLGLICNVAFRNRPPIFLTHFTNTFDVAFTSCALFYLGLVCVNAGTNISAAEKPLLTIVLSLKVLVMPILAIKLYNLFPTHVQSAATGTFVLLYSLSPSSATLLSLASRYAVAPNLVSNLSVFSPVSARAKEMSVSIKPFNYGLLFHVHFRGVYHQHKGISHREDATEMSRFTAVLFFIFVTHPSTHFHPLTYPMLLHAPLSR